jgi:hypothetical protein
MWGWEGLDGRPGVGRRACSFKVEARGTGRGRPSRPSPLLLTTLAPTECDELVLRLMCAGVTLAVACSNVSHEA